MRIEAVLKKIKVELLEEKQRPTVGEFLQARVHEAVTVSADKMAQMGVMTTDERIALSSAVGGMLEAFRKAMQEKCAEAANSPIPEDAMDRLMGGSNG